jgi:hypothetical protein
MAMGFERRSRAADDRRNDERTRPERSKKFIRRFAKSDDDVSSPARRAREAPTKLSA